MVFRHFRLGQQEDNYNENTNIKNRTCSVDILFHTLPRLLDG
jgi:hypothetical protein